MTCWSPTTTSVRCTTRGCPRMSCPRGISTRGGRSSGTRHRTCSPSPATTCYALTTGRVPTGRTPGRPANVALPLTYRFEPGAADDGVTVHVPIDVLARLGGDEFAWQVPALREELITELIRSLPKTLRRNFVPAPDTARAVMSGIDPAAEPLLEGLQRELRRRSGVLVPIDAFDLGKLPPHLRVTFAVESADGAEVAGARTSPPAGGVGDDGAKRCRRCGRRRAGAHGTARLAR